MKTCPDIVIKTWKWYLFWQYLWVYVNLENDFAYWKNFENTIQKKIQKSQKFARKISVAEFRCSQTIFLRLTATLFHSNLDEKITSNEQKVMSNEQKVTSNKQKVTSNEQKVQPQGLKMTWGISWTLTWAVERWWATFAESM